MGYKKLRKNAGEFLKASYEPLNVAEKRMSKKGYVLDKDLSTVESKVFVNKKNNKPVLVERGSSNIKDWVVDDVLIGVGLSGLSSRQQKTKTLNKKIEEKYNKPVSGLGHSLGGHLIENGGLKGNVITYNKAASFADIGRAYNKKQVDLKTRNDLPSFLSGYQEHNVEIIKQKEKSINPFKNAIEAHDIRNLFPDN